jgi:hypothetical protein
VRRIKGLPYFFVALFILGGCRTTRPPPDGELASPVTLIGRVQIDNQVGPQSHGHQCGESAYVAFGSDPSGGADFGTLTSGGRYFSLSAPRGALYLKWIRFDEEESSPLASSLFAPAVCRSVTCKVRQRIDVAPTDGTVYIGTLVCLKAGAGGIFEARDDHASAHDALLELGRGSMPSVRLPSADNL